MELDPLDFGQPGPSQPPTLRRPLALDLLNVRQPLDPGSAWFQAQPRASTSTSFDRSIQVNGQEEEEETALLKELRRTLGPRSTDAPPSSSSPSRPLSISRLLPGSPSRTERLTWQGNKVVWTRGVELVRSFTFESDEIVQVVAFGSFDASSPNSGSLLQRRKSSIEGEETSFVGTGGGPTSGKRRRSTVGGPKKGPRVSEGASFVRQSTHPLVGPHVLSTLAEPALPRSSSPARSTNLPPKKERREQAVCFLLSTSLVVHLSSGARHLVTLPHEMAEMHALPSGGLAVRGSSTRVEDAEAGAGWYVVRHPLNGLREVDEEEEAQMLLHLQDGPSTGLQDGPLSVHLRLDGQHVETGSARDGSVIFSSESRQLGDVVDTLHPASSTPVRVRLPSLDRVDPLVRTCLETLDGPLGQSNLCALRLECLQWASTKRLRDAGGQEEFKSFAETLLELLGIQRQTSHSSLESETPWERMARVNAQSEDPALRALSASAPPSSSKTSALFLSPQADLSLIASVALSLHLLAEDFKLDMLHFHWLRPLGGLAMQLASVLGRQDWVDYWFRQGCPLNDLSTVLAEQNPSSLLPDPPDIYSHLRTVLKGKTTPSWPSISARPSLSATLIDLYSTLASISPSTTSQSSIEVVNQLVAHGITKERLLRFPIGIALPLFAAVKTCQTAPSASWSPAVFKLIRRPDLAADPGRELSSAKGKTTGANSTRTLAGRPKVDREPVSNLSSLSLRFGSDRRLEEVDRLLSTTRTTTFKLREQGGLSDLEVTAQQKAQAGLLVQRTFAIPVGQGMFNYASSTAVITSTFAIPPIDTTVKTSWDGGVHTVAGHSLKPEVTEWPDFANGVAQALRIRPDSEGIDSSWIIYNKPPELNPAHGGFLMGLGLAGHLRKMMPWHAFPYFDARHEPTSVGLLLGFAASHLGTCDPLLTKILSLHVHALLPHGSRELHSTSLVQAASLIGIGLLYLASGNRRMADVALSEAPKQDSSEDAPANGQAYAFAAAMSFGMVMLGRGGEPNRTGDSLLVARLHTLIYGDSSFNTAGRSEFSVPKSTKDVSPDLNVTSAPATLALGLMYLRTGKEEIASMLDIPQTINDLQVVRSDLLFARTLARSLILWDQITDTDAWIESNVPPFIRSPLGKRPRTGISAGVRQAMELAYSNILAGACFALGLKYAGTARSSVHSLLLKTYDVFYASATANASSFQQRMRLNAARSSLCVVALSLAMVMAGTGELSVLSRLRLAHGQHEKFGYGVQQALHMALGLLFLGKGMSTIGNSNTAVAALVCAFYPNFNIVSSDNAAYPQAFRHLWALAVEPRCFVARDVETREPVYLPIKVKTEENAVLGSQRLISPTLLPSLDRLVSVTIDSPRYWPLILNLRSMKSSPAPKFEAIRDVLVKRRSGFLSYADDPRGNRTIFVKAGLTAGIPDLGSMSATPMAQEGLQSLRNSVGAYTTDPFLLAFVRRLCGSSTDDVLQTTMAVPTEELQRFCESVLLECLVNDQPHLIGLYLHARHAGRQATSTGHLLPSVHFSNLQLAREVTSEWQKKAGLSVLDQQESSTLVRQSFLREAAEGMVNRSLRLDESPPLKSNFQSYLTSGLAFLGSLAPTDQADLGLYLTVAQVPPVSILSSLREVILDARQHLGGVAERQQDAVLRMVVKSTLGKMRSMGAVPADFAEGGDMGWVDVALETWR